MLRKPVDDGGDVEGPAGDEGGEEDREPEEQAREADDARTADLGHVVEFFPVGPAVELGFFTAEEEPVEHAEEILEVLFAWEHGGRSEEHFPDAVFTEAAIDADAVDDEVADEDDGEDAVEDARGLGAAEEDGEVLRPGLVGIEEGKAGEGEAEEAEDHKGVVDAVDAVEAAGWRRPWRSRVWVHVRWRWRSMKERTAQKMQCRPKKPKEEVLIMTTK